MCLRCGGKYYMGFVGSLILFQVVKKFLKQADLTKLQQKFGSTFVSETQRMLPFDIIVLRVLLVIIADESSRASPLYR